MVSMSNMKLCAVSSLVLTLIVLGGGALLSSTYASADDDGVIDSVSLAVPIACTMSGAGMTSHNENINNGLYVSNIGTTTLHAFCNDAEGFAIYAAGYTGDEVGGTNSNKLVGTAASGNSVIETGLATSAGNPDVSNWAMKLAATQDSGDTTGTNAFTIDSAPNTSGGADASFTQYHVVPNEYTKVAHKNSGTDLDATIGGVKLTTTYAAYISMGQSADTYSGQVIYNLVHPSSHYAPGAGVSVTYSGNGLQFAGGDTTNVVDYVTDCESIYQGNTPTISKTPNVNNDGTASTGYQYEFTQTDPVTISGADRLKIEIDYGIEANYDFLYVFEGTYSGSVTGGPMEAGQVATLTGGNNQFVAGSSTTLYVDGDTVTFAFFGDNFPDDGYYGYYAKVYPIYATQQADTTPSYVCTIIDSIGNYTEPNHFKGSWTVGGNTFTNEEEVMEYVAANARELATTGLTITAANPYAIVYDGNGASAGTMNGFVTIPDPANPDQASGVNNTVDLMAPNFKKTGYGFAGWSENPNATVNGSDTIYGPSQNINAGALTYDEDNNTSAVLYAVWVQSAGNMQGFSCSSLSTNQITALTDTRDSNVYTVGKMQDGNCWMMENLRLDSTATINSSNTNNPASGFTGLAQSSDDWCTDANGTCINQNKVNTNNTNLGGISASGLSIINGPGRLNGSNENAGAVGNDGNNYSWYAYGNYYNWYTATAGTGTYSVASGNATSDICPNGWSVPAGYVSSSNKGQFSALDSAMGGTGDNQSSSVTASNRWRSYPNNFVYSGTWYGSITDARGFYGHYWSRAVYDNDGAMNFYLSYNKVEINPGSAGKYIGFSVRCLAPGT